MNIYMPLLLLLLSEAIEDRLSNNESMFQLNNLYFIKKKKIVHIKSISKAMFYIKNILKK